MGKAESSSSSSSSDEDDANMAALRSVAISAEQVVAESQSAAAKVRELACACCACWSIDETPCIPMQAKSQAIARLAAAAANMEAKGLAPVSNALAEVEADLPNHHKTSECQPLDAFQLKVRPMCRLLLGWLHAR